MSSGPRIVFGTDDSVTKSLRASAGKKAHKIKQDLDLYSLYEDIAPEVYENAREAVRAIGRVYRLEREIKLLEENDLYEAELDCDEKAIRKYKTEIRKKNGLVLVDCTEVIDRYKDHIAYRDWWNIIPPDEVEEEEDEDDPNLPESDYRPY